MIVPRLELSGVTKRFGPVLANDDVTLSVRGGEVLALLGENGAGKSTLMSILAGHYQPDAGDIVLDGRAVRFASPADALALGIGMVHQRFMLVEAMTAVENVSLAVGGAFRLDLRAEALEMERLGAEHGLWVDPWQRVQDMSMGERQRVEILKLLRLGARVLVFDEPTTVLAPTEIEAFCAMLRGLRDAGRAVIFITHKLDEALDLADRIAILRKGRLVARTTPAETGGKRDLARLMVGREVIFSIDKPRVAPGPEALALRGLTGGPDPKRPAFCDIDLTLRQGEVLALVGVAGNGQTELLEALGGLAPCLSGEIALCGRSCDARAWPKSDRSALAYVPEDRHGEACLDDLPLTWNFALTQVGRYLRGGLLDWTAIEADTRQTLERRAIKADGPLQRAGTLSGGNLQKLVLARALAARPRVLIVHQPTQGLDVGATEAVWDEMLAARAHAGVLLATGDLTEALTLADRVAVMFRGRILDVLDVSSEEDVARISPLMAGVAA
ncbi:ABC transporter ATP-binding protein [Fundidesulfovibrio butyratiphilus]